MPTDTGATNVSGAAARLSQLITEPKEPPVEETAEVQEEQVEEQDVTEATEETRETLDSDTEEQTEEAEELDDTEKERGYLRDKDYRKKTMELGDMRKNVEAKEAALDKKLEDAQLIIEDEMAYLDSKEIQELRLNDPEEYLAQVDKVQAKVRKFEELKASRSESLQAKQAELLQKEQEALFVAFPEWRESPEKMKSDGAELMNTLKDIGYSQDELANFSDHRMFVIADKIKQLNSILNAKPEDKAVKPKPKSVKPGSATTKEDRVSSTVKSQRDRLKKTGKLDDAIQLLQMR